MYFVEADPDRTRRPRRAFVIGRLGVLGNGGYADTTE